MDNISKYDILLDVIAYYLLFSLELDDLPFDLNGRKLHSVLITYVFDDYSTEITQVDL